MGRNDIRALRAQQFGKKPISKTTLETVSDISDAEIETPLTDMLKSETEEINLLEKMGTNSSEYMLIDPNKLSPFPDTKIRLDLHSGFEKEQLKESIEIDGIMNPVLVWKKGEELIILAGHNRVEIAKELGMDVPIIITDIAEDDYNKAKRFVIITNIQNRQIASMKKMEISNLYDSLISSYPSNEYRMTIYKSMQEEFSVSVRSIQEYISLQKLIPFFQQMLNDTTLTMKAALVLVQNNADKQNFLAEFVKSNHITKISNEIGKKLSSVSNWTTDSLNVVFGIVEEKRGRAKNTFKVKYDDIKMYLPVIEDKEIDQCILHTIKTTKQFRDAFTKKNIPYDESKILELIEKYL